jgi:hypothetical protein
LLEFEPYIIATSLQIVKLTGMCASNLELRMREETQEKKELPFLGLELQVTLIGASICKMLVA